MSVDASERNVVKLSANYLMGKAQVEREWDEWVDFLSAPVTLS